MKAATLGNTTRTVGKLFFGLVLLLLAVAAGFGGTALIVYHQLGGSRPAEARVAERAKPERKEAVRPAPPTTASAEDPSRTRPVSATASDVPTYTYADNNGGQPSAPARRSPSAAGVPAPLPASASSADDSAANNLSDPESHYIVDSRTGRVVGIDGSVGARREAEEEQRRLDAAPRAVAVQTPAPEVRVASPVMDEGQPVYHDAPPTNVSVPPGSQYVPVRRAVPVAANDMPAEPNRFNVAEYLAGDRSAPRAQPVYPAGTRTARAVHVFRLPDGTQALVTD